MPCIRNLGTIRDKKINLFRVDENCVLLCTLFLLFNNIEQFVVEPESGETILNDIVKKTALKRKLSCFKMC